MTSRITRPMIRAAAAAAIAVLPAAAAAVPPSPGATPDFYSAPADITAPAGSVVRTQPVPVIASLPDPGSASPAQGFRVMYTSRTEGGAPTVVTGTFIDSARPWTGHGARPTVVIGPGTQGQGDQCAPSRAFSPGLPTDPMSMSANEIAVHVAAWTARGARVMVTDYIGLGTPGVHTYLNRVEQAHAMLDAARAANQLAHTDNGTPIAFWGYSQGGAAAAAAAELQPAFAPELNLKGTWAGAPLADLAAVFERVDGGLIAGITGFAINGFIERHPELRSTLNERLTPAGRALLDESSTECIFGLMLDHPFLHTDTLTEDHRSLLENLRAIPAFDDLLRRQRIGTLTPSTPVLITSGINDDTVPYEQARQLALDWCATGATVTLHSDRLPAVAPGTTIGHNAPEFLDGYVNGDAVGYILDRFDGTPINGCHIE